MRHGLDQNGNCPKERDQSENGPILVISQYCPYTSFPLVIDLEPSLENAALFPLQIPIGFQSSEYPNKKRLTCGVVSY